MARTYICGFELGSLGEAFSSSGTVSVQSTTKRTGGYALRINPTAAQGKVVLASVAAGGTIRNLFQSVRFYFYPAGSFVAGVTIVSTSTSPTAGDDPGFSQWQLSMDSLGRLTIYTSDGATVTAFNTSSLTLKLDAWNLIQVDAGWSSGNGAKVYGNGVEFASVSANAMTPQAYFHFASFFANGTLDYYFDDFVADDGSAVIGAGQQILLKPISDNARGSWTGGAGGTTNLFEAINNIPPIGTASETDLTQIENATNTANQDGLFNTQSYATGGVGAFDTVNAVMAIVNDGEDVATGTKTGGVWVNSNPAQAAGGQSFDYGDDGGALGTFPSGWKTHVGAVAASPSVTLGTSPVVGIRATSATTRVRSADFLGIYVDYTPAPMKPVGIVGRQAVNRASTY
jgi:hypothetical protein